MLDFLKISFNSITLLIILLMAFICIFLFIKVKLLTKQLEKINTKISNNSKPLEKDDDVISIKDISQEVEINKKEEIKQKKKENQTNETYKNNHKKERTKNKIELYQPVYKTNNLKKQAYAKNVLHDRPNITSPISLNNKDFNINDLSPNKNKNNNNYLNEISKKIAKEIKPHTIELTDYEKEQEDNAIISYQELLNAKDKINSQDDEVETIDFIEELKNFRNSL